MQGSRSEKRKWTEGRKMVGRKSGERGTVETKTERGQWSVVFNGAENVQ